MKEKKSVGMEKRRGEFFPQESSEGRIQAADSCAKWIFLVMMLLLPLPEHCVFRGLDGEKNGEPFRGRRG